MRKLYFFIMVLISTIGNAQNFELGVALGGLKGGGGLKPGISTDILGWKVDATHTAPIDYKGGVFVKQGYTNFYFKSGIFTYHQNTMLHFKNNLMDGPLYGKRFLNSISIQKLSFPLSIGKKVYKNFGLEVGTSFNVDITNKKSHQYNTNAQTVEKLIVGNVSNTSWAGVIGMVYQYKRWACSFEFERDITTLVKDIQYTHVSPNGDRITEAIFPIHLNRWIFSLSYSLVSK